MYLLIKHEIGQFVAYPGALRHRAVAAFRLIIVFAQLFIESADIYLVMLVYDEVRYRGFNLQSRGQAKRTPACVDLYRDVICVRHVADFFHLGNAAACAQIRLYYLKRIVFEILCVLPPGIYPFAACYRYVELLRDISGRLRVGRIGLFKKVYIVFLYGAP